MTQEERPKIWRTIKLIAREEALRHRMKLQSWNIYMFAEDSDGNEYAFCFDPTCASAIDEDVTIIHNEWNVILTTVEYDGTEDDAISVATERLHEDGVSVADAHAIVVEECL